MKKTLALLLAIWGTTSFANPGLKEKIRKLSAITHRIKKLEGKKSTYHRIHIQPKEKEITVLNAQCELLKKLRAELCELLPPQPLNSEDLLAQLLDRINTVNSGAFFGKLQEIICIFNDTWTELGMPPIPMPSPIDLIDSAFTFVTIIKNEGGILPWVTPLLEKLLAPSAPHLSYIYDEEFPPLPQGAASKELSGKQRIHYRNIFHTRTLYEYLCKFVTHPFHDTLSGIDNAYDDTMRFIQYTEKDIDKFRIEISNIDDVLAQVEHFKSQLEKEIQRLKNSTAQEANEKTENADLNPAAPSVEDMDPALQTIDPQPDNIPSSQILSRKPSEDAAEK